MKGHQPPTFCAVSSLEHTMLFLKKCNTEGRKKQEPTINGACAESGSAVDLPICSQ